MTVLWSSSSHQRERFNIPSMSFRSAYASHRLTFNATNVDVTSTNYQRTYQSAMALTFALTPRDQFQMLNVSVFPDVYFCGRQKRTLSCQNCALAKTLQSSIHRQNSRRIRQHPQYPIVMNKLRDIFGFDSKRLPWLSAITEAVMAHACHGEPLPCQSNPLRLEAPKCVNQSLLQQMHMILEESIEYVKSSYTYLRLQRLLAYPLLTTIGSKLKVDIKNGDTRTPHFNLYSAHDMTLEALKTSLLGHIARQIVPSASRFTIELYEDITRSEKYYWRVLYNGVDYTEIALACNSQRLYKGLCHFKFLRQYLEEPNYLSPFNRENVTFSDLCRT